MTEAFDALVATSRRAHRRQLGGETLTLWVHKWPGLDDLLRRVDTFRPSRAFQEATECFDVASVADQTELRVEIAGLTSNKSAVAGNLAQLLTFQAGLYQRHQPDEFYLVEDDKWSADADEPLGLLAQYRRMPTLCALLSRIADVQVNDGRIWVFLGERRLDIEFCYDASDLEFLPHAEALTMAEASLFSAPFASVKERLFKNVVRRMLEPVLATRRLGELMRSWAAIWEAFAADFALYQDEFNFEKVRESFEQKKLDYLMKLNAASSDTATKLMAIPVAQGLLVSQMKADVGSALANTALLFGSVLFAVICLMILLGHRHAIAQIRTELSLDRKAMTERFPAQYKRVKQVYDTVTDRTNLVATYPWILGLVLALATGFSVYAYLHVPPLAPPAPETSAHGADGRDTSAAAIQGKP